MDLSYFTHTKYIEGFVMRDKVLTSCVTRDCLENSIYFPKYLLEFKIASRIAHIFPIFQSNSIPESNMM